jgi:hypothetical protein
VCYCINAENWAEMKSVVLDFLNQDVPDTDCC